MASQIEICNLALVKLGADLITGLDQRTAAAQKLSAVYDTTRKAELCKTHWNFAKSRDLLSALTDTPPWGFGFQYQLPSDYLKLIQVNDVFIAPGLENYRISDDSPWSVEDGKILTDFAAPLKIRYIKDVTDESKFSPLFVEVFASKLAYVICYAVTQSRAGQDVAQRDYTAAMLKAANTNAIELPPQGLLDDSWMLSRGS